MGTGPPPTTSSRSTRATGRTCYDPVARIRTPLGGDALGPRHRSVPLMHRVARDMTVARLRTAAYEARWGPETGARLLFVHVGLSALIGVRIVAGSYRQLAGTPGPLFEPVPFLAWLPDMPSAQVFVAIQVIGGLAALAAVLRRHPRAAVAGAWGGLLVVAGLG